MKSVTFIALLLIAPLSLEGESVCRLAFNVLSRGFEGLETQVGQRAEHAGPFEVRVAGITRTVTRDQVEQARNLINEIKTDVLADNNIASAFERFLDIPIEKFVLLHRLDPAASQELATFMRTQIIDAMVQQLENPDQNIFPSTLYYAYQMRFAGISAALRENFKESEFDPYSQEHANFRTGRGQYQDQGRGQYIWEYYTWVSLMDQFRTQLAEMRNRRRREQLIEDSFFAALEGGEISIEFLSDPLQTVYERIESLADAKLMDTSKDEFIALLESSSPIQLFEALDKNYKETDADQHALFEAAIYISNIIEKNTWTHDQRERILDAIARLHNAIPNERLLAATFHLSRMGPGE